MLNVAVGAVGIEVLGAVERGEGETDGVDEDAVDTLVAVGPSSGIDKGGRVAKKVGETVGSGTDSPHPTTENVTNAIVTDCSNL
jgi:hypothetical protein